MQEATGQLVGAPSASLLPAVFLMLQKQSAVDFPGSWGYLAGPSEHPSPGEPVGSAGSSFLTTAQCHLGASGGPTLTTDCPGGCRTKFEDRNAQNPQDTRTVRAEAPRVGRGWGGAEASQHICSVRHSAECESTCSTRPGGNPSPQQGTGLQKQLLGTGWLPECLNMVGCRQIPEKSKQGCKRSLIPVSTVLSSTSKSSQQAELRTQIYKNTLTVTE